MTKFLFLELVAKILSESNELADCEMSGSVNQTTGLNELEIEYNGQTFVLEADEIFNTQ